MAILFAICLWTVLQVLDAGQLEGSAEAQPSLNFRPKPRGGNGNMIRYRADDPSSYQYLINDLVEFLKRKSPFKCVVNCFKVHYSS